LYCPCGGRGHIVTEDRNKNTRMTDEEANQFLEGVRPKLMKEAHALLNGTRQFDVDTAAEDIVQDVMIECWLKGDLEEWKMRCVVMERCNDFFKKQNVRSWTVPMDMDELADAVPPVESEKETDPRWMEVWKAAATLSPALRKTFHAFYFDGDTCEEIAARDGVGVSAVTERLREGRRKIQKKILPESVISARSVA
jgi:RNA polymerase sigma factor (sigma-70 family)